MEDRQVTRSRKGRDGDILALCNPGQYWSPHWSPRQKADVINDIESLAYNCYVHSAVVGRVNIRVVRGPYGKYLRTDPDWTTRNNLDDLPDC